MNKTEPRDINNRYRNWYLPETMIESINSTVDAAKKEEEKKKAEEEAKKNDGSRWGKTSGIIDKGFDWLQKSADIFGTIKNGGSTKVEGETDIVIDPGSGTKTDTKKYVIGGIILLLLVGGGLYFVSKSKNKSKN